jgi:branched-chain amino acid transport system ATP-binding protein
MAADMDEPLAEGTSVILTVDEVSMIFGGITALDDVTFQVPRGSIQGIIGPNGAGKTTLFNVVTGLYRPTSGDVWVGGQSILGLPPFRVAALGVTRTFQTVRLFEGMSVIENVMVGRHRLMSAGLLSAALRLAGSRAEEEEAYEQALTVLDLVGLGNHAAANAVDLPLGWQRRLELARALAANAELLLLDEPAAGLNTSESADLASMIREIAARGTTVVLVEHDMDVVMSVVEDVLVLDYGRVLARGKPQEIQENPDVIRAYLGTEA